MTPRELEVFDSAIDFVERPSLLGGSWGTSATSDLETRMRSANFVGVVTAQTVRTNTDTSNRRTLRIVLHVEDELFGEPHGDAITVSVGEIEPGFDTVSGRERQILERRFVVALKWAEGESGSVVPRWHLSPASDENVAEATRLLRSRRLSSSGN